MCTSQGLPPLPHIPANFLLALDALEECQYRNLLLSLGGAVQLPRVSYTIENVEELGGLTPEQQEANLLHVALWIVERDRKNLHMERWHKLWFDTDRTTYEDWSFWKDPSNEAGFNTCGTVHCLAGFAQVMGGIGAFALTPKEAGEVLLGSNAADHFFDTDEQALVFLEQVIERNSHSVPPAE
jgi:hypothetical protein